MAIHGAKVEMGADKEIKCYLGLPMLQGEKFVIFLRLNGFVQLNNPGFV